MVKTCKCGRIWQLTDHQFIERDPGAIICKCGETLMRWYGSTTWSADLAEGLPEARLPSGKAAIKQLLSAGLIQRIGKGVSGDSLPYFTTTIHARRNESRR